jgi:hypothetical protein
MPTLKCLVTKVIYKSINAQLEKDRQNNQNLYSKQCLFTTKTSRLKKCCNMCCTWSELRCYGRLKCFTSDTVLVWSTDTSINHLIPKSCWTPVYVNIHTKCIASDYPLGTFKHFFLKFCLFVRVNFC